MGYKFTRRSMLTAGVAAPFISSRMVRGSTGRRYSIRAVDLVRRSTVIDMLSPIWLNADLTAMGWKGRLPRKQLLDWKLSGINAINHAVGLGGPDAYESVLAWIAGWNGLISRHTDTFVGVGGVSDIALAKRTGRVAVIRGMQNADHFRTAADIPLFHSLGLRVCQLTYNEQNFLGAGATERVDGGVSDYGAEIIAGMNRVGMLVDTGHSGDRTTQDAIEISEKPIAITHSNCRALADHPRGKTDEAIRKLGAKGGVMGISGIRMFVTAVEPTTMENMVDHYDHVIRIAGIEHVGIGSDADLYGYDAVPKDVTKALNASYKSSYGFREKVDIDGFSHPRKILDLTECLIRRGYTNNHIELILGGNFLRILEEVWRE